jgi:hypothetical protein
MPDEVIASPVEAAVAPVAPVTPEVSQTAATPSVVASPATPAATEFDAHKFIGKNGEFLEGWKEGLIDPTLWKEGFYDNVKDVKGLLKTALDTKKMVGKKTIVPLSDKSTPEEIAAFRQAHGITGKYNYTPPKDIELLDMSPEVLAPSFAKLDKANLSQSQFDVVMGAYSENIKMLQDAVTANDKAEFDEAERIIRAEAGNDYENRVHLANRIIDENTTQAGWPAEKTAKLIEGLNESPLKPYILEFIATVGNKFVEHKIITDMEASLGPADLQAKIYDEMKNPAYMNASDPAHKLQVAKVTKLFQEKEERTKRLQSTGIL